MIQPPDPYTDEELVAAADDPNVLATLTAEEKGRRSQLLAQRARTDAGGPVSRFVENAVQPLAQAPGMIGTVAESLLPTQGGSQARQDLGRSLIDPSVERLHQAAQANREGRPAAAVGNVMAATPIVGPAVAQGIDQMRSGDVAGGAGTLTGIAAPFVAGPAVRGGMSALKGTALGENIAGRLDASATSRMVDTMAPKVGANKVRFGGTAEEVAPALIRDPSLSAFSREGLHGGVQARLAEAEAGLDAAAEARGNTKSYPTKPILDALMDRRRKLTAETIDASNPTLRSALGQDVVPGPNAGRVAEIDRAIAEVRQLGPIARYESLRRIREAYDGPAKAIYNPSMTADYLKAQGSKMGAADVTGAIRESLANFEPDTAKANATYSLYRAANDVLTATQETERVRPKVGRGLMNRMTGAMVGAHEGGTIGGAIGVVAGEIATRASEMAPTFQIAIARRMAAVADALRAGDPAEAQQILDRAVARFPAVKSGLKFSGKMTPAASVGSGVPLAADGDRQRP